MDIQKDTTTALKNVAPLLIALVIMLLTLHTISSVLTNLGLLTDLFVIIGVIQVGKFMFNSEVRANVMDTFNSTVNITYMKSKINKLIKDLTTDNELTKFQDDVEGYEETGYEAVLNLITNNKLKDNDSNNNSLS